LRESPASAAELRKLGYSVDEKVEQRFRTLVPRYYLNLIDRNNPHDPIARMALPQSLKLQDSPGQMRDPIGDLAFQVAPRLTHRYPDRALLHITNLCQMYCRFCFRKNLMNEKEPELYAGDFSEAFQYLKKHSEVEELILSGGDPGLLTDAKLGSIIQRIGLELPQIRRLRFHTRMPVTLPARVTAGLVDALKAAPGVQIIIVSHFNHPKELSADAISALEKLRTSGFLLLNQSVLLKGVNDSAKILRELSTGLGNVGVIPYYLHHCDLVSGGAHFRTSIARGRRIWRELRRSEALRACS
jgi:lysine 2,3-aminomutase